MILKNPFITYRFHEDNEIILAEFTQNLKVDLNVAKEIVTARLEFCKNKNHFIMYDSSGVKQVDPEAREYLQNPEIGLKNILGAAFVVNNPVSELLSQIFVKTTATFPVRLFYKHEEALEWLKKYKDDRAL